MIRVIVDEEYGYRNWIWNAPDNAEDLISEAIKADHFYSSDLPAQFPQGEWHELDYEEFKKIRDALDFDLYAFLHTEEDSGIQTRERLRQR
jgi:hypothetical protein